MQKGDKRDKRNKSPWQETVDAITADSAVEVVGIKTLSYPYYAPTDHAALEKMFDETKDKTRSNYYSNFNLLDPTDPNVRNLITIFQNVPKRLSTYPKFHVIPRYNRLSN